MRHPEKMASTLILWQLSKGRSNSGRKQMIYVDNLMKNTNIEEWKTTISDAR